MLSRDGLLISLLPPVPGVTNIQFNIPYPRGFYYLPGLWMLMTGFPVLVLVDSILQAVSLFLTSAKLKTLNTSSTIKFEHS